MIRRARKSSGKYEITVCDLMVMEINKLTVGTIKPTTNIKK